MSDMMAFYYAEMEAARNEAEAAYFKARPMLAMQINSQKLFRAGFERAFEPLWHRLRQSGQEARQVADIAGKALLELHDKCSAENEAAPKDWDKELCEAGVRECVECSQQRAALNGGGSK